MSLISKATLLVIKPAMTRAHRMERRQAMIRGITMVSQKVMPTDKRLVMMMGITKARWMPINRTNQVSRKANRQATTKATIRGGTMDGCTAGGMAGGQDAAIVGNNVDHL